MIGSETVWATRCWSLTQRLIAPRSGAPACPLDLPQADHFAAELDDFAECILKNRPTRVPGEEGLADLKVIEGIYRSIAEGKAIKLG